MNARERIARRAAQEIKDGDVVNFGIGLPELAADYIPADYDVWIQGITVWWHDRKMRSRDRKIKT